MIKLIKINKESDIKILNNNKYFNLINDDSKINPQTPIMNEMFFNKTKTLQRIKNDNIFFEIVVAINRVTKVTKGGRHFRFGAVVVIGNKKGFVGLGTGKANEVPDAIKKAIKEAKKKLIKIIFTQTTIPHKVIGHFGASSVIIKPAKKGVGIIAGRTVRSVIQLVGLTDVCTKSFGSNTPINVIRATLDGLKQLRTINYVAKLRGKKIEELL